MRARRDHVAVRVDRVALDAVAGGSSLNRDTVRGVESDGVRLTRTRAADTVVVRACRHQDAIDIRQGRGAVNVSADVVAEDQTTHAKVELNCAVAVAGNDV